MNLLAGLACESGIKRLTANIQHDNKPIWQILQALPYEVKRVSAGSLAEVVVDLTKPKKSALFFT